MTLLRRVREAEGRELYWEKESEFLQLPIYEGSVKTAIFLGFQCCF